MQYILFAHTVGLCAREALSQAGLGDDRPCLVHAGGVVVDVNAEALARRTTLGMPLKEAKTILRGDALAVDYVPERFEAVRAFWLEPCLTYSSLIQAERAGEALIDLSGHPDALGIAAALLSEVSARTALPLVAGIAPSVWLARASSVLCDPSALRLGILPVEPVTDPAAWLAPQPVGNLLPVEGRDRKRLRDLGFDRISQVQGVDPVRLGQQFPRRGALICEAAWGRLADPVRPNYPPGVLVEICVLGGGQCRLELDSAIRTACGALVSRLCKLDKEAKSIALTLFFEDGNRAATRRNLPKPVASASQLSGAAGQLLSETSLTGALESFRLELSDLSPARQRQVPLGLGLGDDQAKRHLSDALNRVNQTHGTGSVMRASAVKTSFNQQVLKEWKRATGWR